MTLASPAAMAPGQSLLSTSQHRESHALASSSHRCQVLIVRRSLRRSAAAKGIVCSATLQRQAVSTGSHLPAASWRTDFSARYTLGNHIGSGRWA